MGMTCQLKCTCGYQKQLSLGGGLNSHEEYVARATFSEEELAPFDAAKANNSLKRQVCETHPAVCSACQELVAMPLLRYWAEGKEHILQKDCPTCGGHLERIPGREIPCPKCGKVMEMIQSGRFD